MIYIPDPPDWFKHEPAPDKPVQEKAVWNLSLRTLTPYGIEFQKKLDEWEFLNQQTRYWQWVRYYTDQMRRIVPELFGGTVAPAAPGTYSAVDPGSATSNFIPGPTT